MSYFRLRRSRWPQLLRILVCAGIILLLSTATPVAPAPAQEATGTIPPQFHVASKEESDRAFKLLESAIALYEDNPARARDLLHQSLRIFETSWGPNHPKTAEKYAVTSYILWGAGWLDAAEEMGRREIAIDEKVSGLDSKQTYDSISSFARLVEVHNEPEQAETLFRAIFDIGERHAPGGLGSAYVLQQLGNVVATQGRHDEAQGYFDRSVAMREALEGPTTPLTGLGLQSAGENLYARRRYAAAEALLKRAAAIPRGQFNSPPQLFPEILRALGRAQQALGRLEEADRTLSEAVSLARAGLDPRSPYRVDAEAALGGAKRRLGQFEGAVQLLRQACTIADVGQLSRPRQRALTQCFQDQVLALAGWSAAGGGRGVDNRTALRTEAFDKVQFAELFESGYALSRYGARIEATARGVETDALGYDNTQRRYNHLRILYANSFVEPSGAARRPGLIRDLEAATTEMMKHRNRIRLQSPLYWELQAPAAINVASLQAREGHDARLLGKDEALIIFLVPPGDDHGVVFAVSKERFDWAQISLTGDQIAGMVSELRGQIDKGAYDSGRPAGGRHNFNRKTAYDLHQALFGDPKIVAVISGKPSFLIVPSGPLTSLPPGVLVTARPAGGPAADGDPDTLRATRWLLRDKALTVLPAVSSLRTLRQLLSQREGTARAPDPLVAFADPDFAGIGHGYAPVPVVTGASADPTERGAPKAAETYFRGDRPLAEGLRSLRRLAGTGAETEAVRKRLGAPADSVNLGSNASETRLRELQAKGQLARARVVQFATHGLVAGELAGLAQPALVLAAPSPRADPALDDGLLTAAEAATLKLNADWVILSACNTAAPGSPSAQGLSGLSRGFFYAGARSLLISHWRVRDDVAPILVPDILARLADGRAGSKAEALRQAALAILDNREHPDFANPFAWAPFVLVGETAR